MSADKPTDQQRAVIEADEDRFVVTAAAGAGKTRVLVERYLRHVIEEDLRPDQILTITFTKKAAAEMKERIVKALLAQGLTEQAQIAETGPIQTIHSFCERLLRENALAAGLDPAFDILSEAQSGRLATACIRDALAGELTPEADELLTLLAGRRESNRDNRSPYAVIESAVHTVMDKLRASGAEYAAIRDRYATVEGLRSTWETALIGALPLPVQKELAGTGTLQERIQRACKAANDKVPSWARGPLKEQSEEEALRHTVGLVSVALEAWSRLYGEMNRLQSLDFVELEARAVRLLSRSDPTRRRVQSQFAVVMVDEAQDLNPTQYRLLEQLGITREMRVGDRQQSIYGFRETDVALFEEHLRTTKGKRLSKNHRSEPGILAFVDTVFSRHWGKEYVPMSEPGELDLNSDKPVFCEGVELWEHDAPDTVVTAQLIADLLSDGVKAGEVAVLVRAMPFAVDLKARLDAIGIESRIVGGSERFYARLEVRDLANTLRAIASPGDDFALLACLRSPVVGLSLDSIVLLGQTPNVAERLSTFDPPVEGDKAKLMAFLAWYLPLKGIGDRLPAWEVLSEVFARSNYLPALARRSGGEQQIANVRKLLALAAQEPELGPLEYAERIREIQDIRHREGDAPSGASDANVVKISTIHKAKGLEYKLVVVPQTGAKLESRHSDVMVDGACGLVATSFNKPGPMMHRYLSERRKRKDEEEELRVLYVALTRAQKRLCVCTYPARGQKTLSKLIMDAIGGPLPGMRVRQLGQEPQYSSTLEK